MAITELDGRLYREMVEGGARRLAANVDVVNNLNVFPIPDGDTGDNMRMTLEGGLRTAVDTADLGASAAACADGMLLGARGNSGVILSQFFGGIAKGLEGVAVADPAALGRAFESGVKQAYAAVNVPTEGTILTVAREATAAAVAAGAETIEDFFAAFIAEMRESLDRTPDLLPVLKEAGVVDSGGAGLIYIFEGMERILHGETVEGADLPAAAAPAAVDVSSFTADSVMEFGYCTEFLLRLQTCKVDVASFDVQTLIDYLETIGESIVAFKNDSIVKVHVHTFTPGKVLDYCQRFGEFLTLKIENMCIQHNESTVENRYARRPQEVEHKEFAVVAVATGRGLSEAFEAFGADAIVEGGQTMNPSAEDFITAFRSLDADHIIVMPNNGNILMAAEQAAALYTDADVRVLKSKTLAEGYAALQMLDYSSGDIDCILDDLQMAVDGVETGMITTAVRDTVLDGVTVKKDDYIGFSGKTMLCDAPDKVTAACELLERMDKEDREVLVAICGADTTPEEVEAVRAYAAAHFPAMEWYALDGGQDVYSFIFAVE